MLLQDVVLGLPQVPHTSVQDDMDETRGMELKSSLSSADVLSSLFLSVLCLHHYLHEFGGHLDVDAWRSLHDSVGDGISASVLQKIYELISATWIPEFSIPSLSRTRISQRNLLSKLSRGAGPDGDGSLPWLEGLSAKQGWASLESTPAHDIGENDFIWASISHGLLFFSHSDTSVAPEACVALSGVHSFWDGERIILEKATGRTDAAATAGKAHVTVALLKQDGSWKECHFLQLELVFEDPQSWLHWLENVDINSV